MKFSDIDFSALKHMVDSLSDEEKESLNEMASAMTRQMGNEFNFAAQNFEEEIKEQQEDLEEDYAKYLHLDESFVDSMDGHTLAMLEAGSDMEQYYEDIEDADLSASVLFYTKALLSLLRKHVAPILAEELELSAFEKPQMTTLMQYGGTLNNTQILDSLQSLKPDTDWRELLHALSAANMLLMRAEYDTVQKRDLQVLKDLLFTNQILYKISCL